MSGRVFGSVFRQGLFDGKVALITGGGTGIGRCIAEEFVHLGGSVMIASRKEDRLREAADEMRSELGVDESRIGCVKCNIREEKEVDEMVEATLSRFSRIDGLVNNGGGQFAAGFNETNLKGWKAVVETNLTGTFNVTKAVYDKFMKSNGGSIVNITVCNRNGFAGMAHSGAARAGVENLSMSLTMEWAADGVRINNVAPGSVYSPTAAANYPFDVFEYQRPFIPYKRLGTVEEVSSAVIYLLSPASNFISGVTIEVDGGQSLSGGFWQVPDHQGSKPYRWESQDSSENNSGREE